MPDDSESMIDAVKVDFWALNEKFYEDYLDARLDGAADTPRRIKELGIRLL